MVSILANNTLVKYGSENRYVEGDEDAAAVSSDAFNFINAIFDSEPEYDMTWSFNNDRFDVKVYTRHVAESKIELTYSIMQVERQAAEVFALARRRLNFVRNGGGAHSGRRYEEACEFPAATNGPGDRCLVTRAASREGLVWAPRAWRQLHAADARTRTLLSAPCGLRRPPCGVTAWELARRLLPLPWDAVRAREVCGLRVEEISTSQCRVLGIRWADMGGAFLPAYFMTKYICDTWTNDFVAFRQVCELSEGAGSEIQEERGREARDGEEGLPLQGIEGGVAVAGDENNIDGDRGPLDHSRQVNSLLRQL